MASASSCRCSACAHGERGGVPPGLPARRSEAFLEAHEHAFAYFGGVHRVLRYDNLASAVRKVLRGHRREETVRFIAFRSHWRFEAQFCTPAAGHEKGRVEGENGYFRRNHWVPVPQAADLGALNQRLLAACRADSSVCWTRDRPVGEAMALERHHLLPAAAEGFELAEPAFPWSMPAAASRSAPTPIRCRCGRAPRCRPACAAISRSWHEAAASARHRRCHSRRQQILDLDHYLDVLERKPGGAMAGCKPLRASGVAPAAGRPPTTCSGNG